jgi:phospholipid N-methyltransferase
MDKQDQSFIRQDKRLAFFKSFLRKPQIVGSVIPSSRFMERNIVEYMDVPSARLIVEFGPGTGGTTRAVLKAMSPDAKLLCIELNQDFIPILQEIKDPRLIVHNGDVERLPEILQEYGLDQPDAVFSGIPFSTIPEEKADTILRQVYKSLSPGGRFVAYQFRDKVAIVGRNVFGAPQVKLGPLNIPPMRIYCWLKNSGCKTSAE